jgi:hypothetical protein
MHIQKADFGTLQMETELDQSFGVQLLSSSKLKIIPAQESMGSSIAALITHD